MTSFGYDILGFGSGGLVEFTATLSSNTANANLRTVAVAQGWDENSPLSFAVASGVYAYSTNTNNAGLIVSGSYPNGLIITNSGYIIGMGGGGGNPQGPLNSPSQNSGTNGGPALSFTSGITVDITNQASSFIAGGGGGGGYSGGNGGQGGGGAGQSGSPGSSGSNGGGSLTDIYCNAGGTLVRGNVSGTNGYGGGAGGGSGYAGTWSSPGCTSYGGAPMRGGLGGRSLPGSGGGDGGSAGNAGSGTGGGGWGAAGGGTGAGSGGAAITGSFTSLTNNGTIYGSTS